MGMAHDVYISIVFFPTHFVTFSTKNLGKMLKFKLRRTQSIVTFFFFFLYILVFYWAEKNMFAYVSH